MSNVSSVNFDSDSHITGEESDHETESQPTPSAEPQTTKVSYFL